MSCTISKEAVCIIAEELPIQVLVEERRSVSIQQLVKPPLNKKQMNTGQQQKTTIMAEPVERVHQGKMDTLPYSLST